MIVGWRRWVDKGHQQRLPLGSWFAVVIYKAGHSESF